MKCRAQPVPPPARRLTSCKMSSTSSCDGSSARAEIDPIWPGRRGCYLVVPPPARRSTLTNPTEEGLVYGSSPARRSTLKTALESPKPRGSSARAEIDPSSPTAWASSPWFLRPRGDRPAFVPTTNGRMQVPPPARRSTLPKSVLRWILVEKPPRDLPSACVSCSLLRPPRTHAPARVRPAPIRRCSGAGGRSSSQATSPSSAGANVPLDLDKPAVTNGP